MASVVFLSKLTVTILLIKTGHMAKLFIHLYIIHIYIYTIYTVYTNLTELQN